MIRVPRHLGDARSTSRPCVLSTLPRERHDLGWTSLDIQPGTLNLRVRRSPTYREGITRPVHYLTHRWMDVGESHWTPLDRIIREFVRARPLTSAAFALPTVRNRQVIGSSPIAGSKFPDTFDDLEIPEHI